MKRIIFVVLVSLWSRPVKAIDVDSLLIKSVGGPEAYEFIGEMSSYRMDGALSFNGMPGRFEVYYMVPDKFYMEFDFGQFSMAQAFDGRVAWKRDHNGQITEITGTEREELLKEIYWMAFAYLFPERIPGDMEYIDIVDQNDQLFHKMAFYPLEKDTIEAYFEVSSGLYRYSTSYTDNIKTISRADDYREVSGVLIPFLSRSEAPEIPLVIEMQVETVEFNADLDGSRFSHPGVGEKDYYFTEHQERVVLFFEYRNGHIYLEGKINGQKTVSFILDSGATANIFNESAIAPLGLPEVGTLPAKGMGGFEEVSLVRTDSINIGQLTLYNQVAGSMDLSGIGSIPPDEVFGGVLGFDFLSRFPMMIDYERQLIVVYNPETFTPPEGDRTVPFELFMQVPVIEATLVGIPGKFVVDLGNAFGLVLHENFVDKYRLEDKLDNIEDIKDRFGGIGGLLSGKTAYAASFEFGDVRVTSLRVVLAEGGTGIAGSEDLAGNIGNLILENFKVLFDYARKEITFYEAGE